MCVLLLALLTVEPGPAAVVDAFHVALKRGDREAVLALLDPEVRIFEAGGVERSRDEYAAHHLDADIAFVRGVVSTQVQRREQRDGALAWVETETQVGGAVHGQPLGSRGVETMILQQREGRWHIVHIHWSSQRTDPPALIDVAALAPHLRFDIRYATPDNFTKQQLYPVARCLLRPEVAAMVVAAQQHLDVQAQGYVLLLKDCYRPESVQKRMWEVVKGTPLQAYVANPYSKTGSVHTYGCAADVTLADRSGQEVDMGTAYDHLGILAEPRHEKRFVAEGKLTREQIERRQILRSAMTRAGFKGLAHEWWHFDAWQGAALRQRYQRLDLPLEVPAH